MTSSRKSPFEKLSSHLVNIGEHWKFMKLFSKHKSFQEMFAEIWERKDLAKVINLVEPNVNYNRKVNKLAEKFLLNGNRLCHEKKLNKALLAYNYAILAACHPTEQSFQDGDNKKDSICPLVLAYATRSALLYEMERYEESMRDIDKAVEYGYPAAKIDKLEQRKIKCLLRMNKNKDAEKKVKELLDKAKLSKKKNSINELEQLLNQCKLKNKDSKIDSTNLCSTNIDLFQRGPDVPPFIKKYNKDKDINIINAGIKVHYSPAKGKHLIATKDIEPGEILMIEKAFCSIPKLDEMLRFYCCVCLRKTSVPLPCDKCSLVIFCSDDCFKSKHNNHSLECSLLPVLLEMKIDEELGLVFRTLLKFTMEQILSELENAEDSKKSFDSKDIKLFLQNPATYSTLTKLEGNLEKRSGDSILEGVSNAVFGVKLLQKLPQFWERKNKSESLIEQTEENLIILGGEVTKLLLNFQCNIHCLKELQIDTETNILSSNSYEAGYGIYRSFSLMNHSCAPNVLHSSWGDIKFLYSINFIPKGEEIVDSYGERFVSHELKERQKNLKDVYYFDCECQACIKDWPLFQKLSKDITFVCPFCDVALDKTTAKCGICNKNFNAENADKTLDKNISTPKIYDLKAVEKQLKSASALYEVSFKDLNEYRFSFKTIKNIGMYISLLAKYTRVPHVPLIEAQEALLRCFDLMGSYSYKGYTL